MLPKIAKIISFLNENVGKPYVWNCKTGNPGWDCSGLSKAALKEGGIDLPDGSYNQAKVGREIPVAAAHAGCLIFKKRPWGTVFHVGIVGANNTVYEARGKKFGVVHRALRFSEWAAARKIDSLYSA